MSDEHDDWEALEKGSFPPPATRRPLPNLLLILVMWALVACAYVFQITHLGLIARFPGFASFVLAIFLIVRGNKAAKTNGVLRLLFAVVNAVVIALTRFH